MMCFSCNKRIAPHEENELFLVEAEIKSITTDTLDHNITKEFAVHELHCDCFKLYHKKCYTFPLLGQTCLKCGQCFRYDYCYGLGELETITKAVDVSVESAIIDKTSTKTHNEDDLKQIIHDVQTDTNNDDIPVDESRSIVEDNIHDKRDTNNDEIPVDESKSIVEDNIDDNRSTNQNIDDKRDDNDDVGVLSKKDNNHNAKDVKEFTDDVQVEINKEKISDTNNTFTDDEQVDPNKDKISDNDAKKNNDDEEFRINENNLINIQEESNKSTILDEDNVDGKDNTDEVQIDPKKHSVINMQEEINIANDSKPLAKRRKINEDSDKTCNINDCKSFINDVPTKYDLPSKEKSKKGARSILSSKNKTSFKLLDEKDKEEYIDSSRKYDELTYVITYPLDEVTYEIETQTADIKDVHYPNMTISEEEVINYQKSWLQKKIPVVKFTISDINRVCNVNNNGQFSANIIKFWMLWISRLSDDIDSGFYICPIDLYSKLMDDGFKFHRVRNKIKFNILQKKMIILPIALGKSLECLCCIKSK
jgi:hypothetical protein